MIDQLPAEIALPVAVVLWAIVAYQSRKGNR